MLGLSKPVLPVVLTALTCYLLSPFTQYGWVLPLVVVFGYWMNIFIRPNPGIVTKQLLINKAFQSWMKNITARLDLKKVKWIPTGTCSGCAGAFKNKYVMINKVDLTDSVIQPIAAHELSHLYYNHPLINASYYTGCMIFVSLLSLTGNYLFMTVFTLFLFPLTIFKTIQMEIAADRLADMFSDMKAYLKRNMPDSKVRQIRMAALSGNSD